MNRKEEMEALADRVEREWPCCAQSRRDEIAAALRASAAPEEGMGYRPCINCKEPIMAISSFNTCEKCRRLPSDSGKAAPVAWVCPECGTRGTTDGRSSSVSSARREGGA